MRSALAVAVAAAALTCFCVETRAAQPPRAPTTVVKESVENIYRSLLRDPLVKAALAGIKADDANTFEEQKAIAQVPAPSFNEGIRAQDYARRLRGLGLENVALDSEGNVTALRKGAGKGPTLVLSAHLDTVFPQNTDLTVTQRDGRFYGPGLGDDSRGLAAVLAVARAMQAAKIRTSGDVLFVGTVGEEGLGNLRGVKALFRSRPDIDGFISVEPAISAASTGIVSKATGSRRWSIQFNGPGGHSYVAFGVPSAVHAMGRAIALIADLRPPVAPKTTFTVGVAGGGTSVNTIAAEAHMEVDIRSETAIAMEELERSILVCVERAVDQENKRWNSQEIRWEKQLLGDRPAGETPEGSSIVQAALQSARALGLAAPALDAKSTDSNTPMALGIPAVTLTGGGLAGGLHSLNEWFEPADAWKGPQHILLTALALVGVEGVTAPLLAH